MTRPFAHLRPDLGDLGGAELRHGPVAGAAGDLAHEIGDERGAVRRVHHLGVELDAIEPARIVGDGRERRAIGDGDGAEARRQLGHAVAMAHPDGGLHPRLPDAVEQRRRARDLERGAAELAGVAAFDLAAQLRHHGLLAIADAEHGHARVEDRLRRPRRARLMHAGRTARQDDGLGQDGLERGFGPVEGHDLGIDARLAHPPRDQLRVLRAEIDDEDFCPVSWPGV